MEKVITKEELKEKIFGVIKGMNMGSLATVRDGRPWVRYMMVEGQENLDILFSSAISTGKVRDINADPHCHLIVGGNPQDPFTKPYVHIMGKAHVVEDMQVKKNMWKDYHAMMFKGPEDPNYAVIQIKPETILVCGDGRMEPLVYEVK